MHAVTRVSTLEPSEQNGSIAVYAVSPAICPLVPFSLSPSLFPSSASYVLRHEEQRHLAYGGTAVLQFHLVWVSRDLGRPGERNKENAAIWRARRERNEEWETMKKAKKLAKAPTGTRTTFRATSRRRRQQPGDESVKNERERAEWIHSIATAKRQDIYTRNTLRYTHVPREIIHEK